MQLRTQSVTQPRCTAQSVRPALLGRRVLCAAQEQSGASSVCKTCGIDLSKAEKGCDGEGRIVGGMGALPGFGWWPIKAYRPCTNLNQAGIDYVRKGQITNDVLFGGVSLGKEGAKSLEEIKKVADKGIKVE